MFSKYFNKPFFIFFFTLIFTSSSHSESYMALSFGSNELEEIKINELKFSVDEKDNKFSFTYGHKIDENFSFEFSYIDFGEIEKTIFNEDDLWGIDLAADGFTGSLKFSNKISNNFSIYGKLGLLFWDAKSSFSWTSGPDDTPWDINGLEDGVVSGSDDGNDFFYGFGFDYLISDDFSIGYYYDMYELDDIEINSAGFKFSLGFN